MLPVVASAALPRAPHRPAPTGAPAVGPVAAATAAATGPVDEAWTAVARPGPADGRVRSDVQRPARSYAESAYRRAGCPADGAAGADGDVEVTLRRLADGTRLAVARRARGGHTASIEAVVGA